VKVISILLGTLFALFRPNRITSLVDLVSLVVVTSMDFVAVAAVVAVVASSSASVDIVAVVVAVASEAVVVVVGCSTYIADCQVAPELQFVEYQGRVLYCLVQDKLQDCSDSQDKDSWVCDKLLQVEKDNKNWAAGHTDKKAGNLALELLWLQY